MHYADHYFEESGYDKRALDAESASALPDLYRAIRDERSHPLPSVNNPEWPDEFEMELIAAIGAIVPAARQAVPWMFEDLRHLETLGRGDYRVDVETSRMQAFLYTLDQNRSCAGIGQRPGERSSYRTNDGSNGVVIE